MMFCRAYSVCVLFGGGGDGYECKLWVYVMVLCFDSILAIKVLGCSIWCVVGCLLLCVCWDGV